MHYYIYIYIYIPIIYFFFFIISADSSFVPPLIYAMMGSSRDLAVGTVAVASLLTASMLGQEVNALENPSLYLHLAFTATLFAGVFQASLGFLRLVFIDMQNQYILFLFILSKLIKTFVYIDVIMVYVRSLSISGHGIFVFCSFFQFATQLLLLFFFLH